MLYKEQNRRGRRSLLLLTVLVILIFVSDFFTHGSVRGVVRATGTGVTSMFGSVFSGVTHSGFFSTKASLQSENDFLKNQLVEMNERLAYTFILEKQNDELRSLAHMASSTKGLSARIISAVSASPYGTFLIGAGSEDGVEPGAVVLSPGGFVVGKVIEVESRRSLVQEIFRAGASVEVSIDDILVTLVGKGGGNAFGNAPRGSNIATGTAALALAYKRKPVGIVAYTEGDETSASLKTYIRTPVNMHALIFVYVENP